jgi:hypothetical protein
MTPGACWNIWCEITVDRSFRPSDYAISIGMGVRSFRDEAQVKCCIYNDLQIYKTLHHFKFKAGLPYRLQRMRATDTYGIGRKYLILLVQPDGSIESDF